MKVYCVNMEPGIMTLSLCMIVKNGGQFLAKCLESIRHIVSEIIVVDTGSTDASVEIARKYGAIIEHDAWDDDFSKARNKAISRASGDWIFCLDADEEFDKECTDELLLLLNNSDVDAYYVNIISPKDSHGLRSTIVHVLPRLFRNHLGIRFEGRVHEQILPSVNRIRARIKGSNIRVIHHGYNLGVENEKEKLLRNLKILKKEVDDNSKNAYVYFNLGETYSLLNDSGNAVFAYEKTLELKGLPEHLNPVAIQNYGTALFKLERYQEALDKINLALSLKDDLLMAHVIGALIYMKLEAPQNAVQLLEKLVTIMNNQDKMKQYRFDVLPDMTYVYTILAHTYNKNLSNPAKALVYYQLAIRANSRFHDTYTGFAEILFNQKKYAQALKNYQQGYLFGARDHAIYTGLMQCYYELGNKKKAMEMIQPLINGKQQFAVAEKYRSLVESAKGEMKNIN